MVILLLAGCFILQVGVYDIPREDWLGPSRFGGVAGFFVFSKWLLTSIF